MIFILHFKLMPCPIHWMVYMLAYLNFILNFKAVLALPKTARSAQTHKSIIFIWMFRVLGVYNFANSKSSKLLYILHIA